MKIMIVDDHKIIRDCLRILLEKLPDIEIVAEAEDGITAVELVRKTSPDVVIMDISLPALNGVEATRKIISENPGVRVIALTMYSDKWSLEKMIQAGACGYLNKNCGSEEIVQALKACEGSSFYLGKNIVGTVVNEYLTMVKRSNSGSVLTQREREVLQLIAEGKTTGEIAALLNVSKKTVETHRSQIMSKLGLNNLAELVKFAVRERLISV